MDIYKEGMKENIIIKKTIILHPRFNDIATIFDVEVKCYSYFLKKKIVKFLNGRIFLQIWHIAQKES